MTMPLQVSLANVAAHVRADEVAALAPFVRAAHAALEAREGPAREWAGWLHLPSTFPADALTRLKEVAHEVREEAEVFVSVGIGGSYLGARAAIEFASDARVPEVAFYGQHLGAEALASLDHALGERPVCANVISRSGSTVEPGVAFRFLRDHMARRYGRGAAARTLVTSVKGSPLWRAAEACGFRTFEIPRDVGGRYSAFTPVVLLPAAVAGVDPSRVLAGAAVAEAAAGSDSLDENLAYRLAAVRRLLHDKGKTIEVMAACDPCLHHLGQWWRQLAGESEGKGGRGIFPACADYTGDLHSLGQWMQQGRRDVFETFLVLGRPRCDATVPAVKNAGDGLDYLAGRTVSALNRAAYEATAQAHLEGGVPNLAIELSERSPEALGAFFYFFMRAVAITAMLFGVNPFDQPGVEAYKDIMYRLLGRE